MEPSVQPTPKPASQNAMLAGPIMDIAPPKQDSAVTALPGASQSPAPAAAAVLPPKDNPTVGLAAEAPEVPSTPEGDVPNSDGPASSSVAAAKAEQPKNLKKPKTATGMPVAVMTVAAVVCVLLIIAAFMVYKKG